MTSWPSQTLGDVCSLVTDGKHGDCKNEENSGFYFLSAKNIKDGRIDYEGAREIVESDFAETHRRTDLQPGDLVVTNTGSIGRMAIAPDDERTFRTTFQKSVAVLKPRRTEILPKFLYYYLNANLRAFIHPAAGAAQKNLLLGDIRRFQIKKPRIHDQEHLASVLSAYDELIENNRRRIGLLEEAARLLYREWFVHLRFPGHEHVKTTDGLPEGWERRTLVDLAEVVMGQSPKSQFYNDTGNGLPFHQGVTDYGFRFVSHRTYSTMVTKIAEAGDILVSVRAPVGRINLTRDKIVLGRGLAAVRSQTGHQSFLFYALKNHFYAEDIIGSGAIYAATNKKELEGQELVVPSSVLLTEFEAQTATIDEQITNLTNQNEKLTQARDLLLPRLMNGEIAV